MNWMSGDEKKSVENSGWFQKRWPVNTTISVSLKPSHLELVSCDQVWQLSLTNDVQCSRPQVEPKITKRQVALITYPQSLFDYHHWVGGTIWTLCFISLFPHIKTLLSSRPVMSKYLKSWKELIICFTVCGSTCWPRNEILCYCCQL